MALVQSSTQAVMMEFCLLGSSRHFPSSFSSRRIWTINSMTDVQLARTLLFRTKGCPGSGVFGDRSSSALTQMVDRRRDTGQRGRECAPRSGRRDACLSCVPPPSAPLPLLAFDKCFLWTRLPRRRVIISPAYEEGGKRRGTGSLVPQEL